MIRRLITDADVLLGRVTSPIVLDEGTLLTPAARDRARLQGMVIVERGGARPAGGGPAGGEGPAGAAAGTAGCARCGRCDGCGCDTGRSSGLADGLYLVRIEAGRTVSVLPAAGPGQMTPASGRLR